MTTGFPAARASNPTRPHQRTDWVAVWRRSLGAAFLIVTIAASGCAPKDTRISLDELQSMEVAAQPEPIANVSPSQLALTELKPYRVRVGDVLNVHLTGLRDDRYAETLIQARIHNDGTVTLPVVGALLIQGKTLSEVEQAIIAAHVPAIVKDLSVFVELTAPEDTTVLVLGAATAPGLVKLPHNQRNVLYALASAGGFGTAGSGRILLKPVRPEKSEVAFNLNRVDDVRRALLAPPLESGDVLMVEAADPSVVYVSGLVNAPQPVPVPRDSSLSLMRAVTAAGGLIDFLEPDEATLWRQLPDGSQARALVDLMAIRNGEAPDLALRSGDILDIPHTSKTRFRQWFVENVRFGPFGMTAVYDPVADYRARILRDDRNNNTNLLQQTLLQSLGSGVADLVIPPVVP